MLKRDPNRRLVSKKPVSGRTRIDLRALPTWAQYVLSLTTVAIVVWLARRFGKGDPVPHWLTEYLIPALGIIYLALVVVLVVARLLRKR